METKPFRVTKAAGTHVAGERVRDADIKAGKKPLHLTASQAEHELRNGHIIPFVEKVERESGDGKKKT